MKNFSVEIGSVFPLESLDIDTSTKLKKSDLLSLLNLQENTLFLSLGREGFNIIAKNHPENNKVLLPNYTCQTVCDPFVQLGWDIDTYYIDIELKINIPSLKDKIDKFNPGVVVFHPYYGTNFTNEEIEIIADIKNKGIIVAIDYTQSIYTNEHLFFADYVIGSLRKWFDCPDGGFIYSNYHDISTYSNLPENKSFFITQADSMYLRGCYFKTDNQSLKDISIRLNKQAVCDAENNIKPHSISEFGMNRLLNADIENYRQIRFFNYKYLYNNLLQNEQIKFVYNDLTEIISSPLYFPIYCKDRHNLQKQLVKNKVYAPILWEVPVYYKDLDSNSKYIYDHILVIPIDQRYSTEEMGKICDIINTFSKFEY